MTNINAHRKRKETTVTFEAVGWRSLLQTRGGTSRILVLKSVVRGLCLERGQPVYSYIGEDAGRRQVMVSYLDGQPRFRQDGEGDDR